MNDKAIEISLLMLDEDISPDLSNFDTSEFVSTSTTLVGVGFPSPISLPTPSIYQFEIIDLNTAQVGLLLEPNRYYLLAAYFPDSSRFVYQGFSEDHVETTPNTLLYTDRWYRNGFYGRPNAVLRLYLDAIDFDCTTNTRTPPTIDFDLVPNPVSSYLTLQLAFEEASDAHVVFTDMMGRKVLTEYHKGLTSEQLTFPVSQLPDGAYAIRITTKEGSLTKKFIVQKE